MLHLLLFSWKRDYDEKITWKFLKTAKFINLLKESGVGVKWPVSWMSQAFSGQHNMNSASVDY